GSEGGCGGLLLRVRDTDGLRELRNLPEVPVDDLTRWACGWGNPITKQLGDDRERRGRHSAGVREPLDRGAVSNLGSTTDGVGDEHRVVAVLQGLDRRERETDLA